VNAPSLDVSVIEELLAGLKQSAAGYQRIRSSQPQAPRRRRGICTRGVPLSAVIVQTVRIYQRFGTYRRIPGAEGLIEHNAHILEARTKLFKDYADNHFMTFYGQPSQSLLELLNAHQVEFKWFSFVRGLAPSAAVS
jgi:hypothetical protein